MKITQAVTIASALVLAAGCAHEEHHAQYDTTVSPGYSSSTTTENNFSSPSANGAYSTGNGGTVSAGGTGEMSVQGSSSASDNVIVGQVRESLQQDPEIAPIVPNIQISANNGIILLSGSVQSEEQKRQIVARVQKASGVVTVNNQLNVISNSNQNQNPKGSQLNPTGGTSSQPLYKDAGKEDNSTNNVLNPTSMPNGQSQIYQQSNQGKAGQEQDTNNSSNRLNPTSRTNGASQIYRQGSQNQDTNNASTNSLNPTSRENTGNQIYQQSNPGEKGQMQNTNSNQVPMP